jgi:predicted NACHT family NTPase
MDTSQQLKEVQRLLAHEHELREHIHTVDAQTRAAGAELTSAREHLIQLEAGSPTAKQRADAERRLAAASEQAGKPWLERRAGAERAAATAHQQAQTYVADNLDAIIDELEENGRAAADQVDQAAGQFLAAVAARAAADQTAHAVLSLGARIQPGDIAGARSDEAAIAVRRLLEQGGEAAPTLRREPTVVA